MIRRLGTGRVGLAAAQLTRSCPNGRPAPRGHRTSMTWRDYCSKRDGVKSARKNITITQSAAHYKTRCSTSTHERTNERWRTGTTHGVLVQLGSRRGEAEALSSLGHVGSCHARRRSQRGPQAAFRVHPGGEAASRSRLGPFLLAASWARRAKDLTSRIP